MKMDQMIKNHQNSGTKKFNVNILKRFQNAFKSFLVTKYRKSKKKVNHHQNQRMKIMNFKEKIVQLKKMNNVKTFQKQIYHRFNNSN